MSLVAMSLALRFYGSRKGGTGGGGANGMAGLGYRKALVGTEWAKSSLLCDLAKA